MIPAEVLRRIPGCEQGAPPLAVRPLPGGRGCNLVLQVETLEGRFVWRCRLPPVERPGSAPLTELRSQLCAARAGLAPPVLDADPAGRWLLMEYVDAPVWTAERLLSLEGIEALGQRLATLHALPLPPDLPELDAPAIAQGYLAQVSLQDPAMAPVLQPLVDQVRSLSHGLADLGGRRVLNHGDLQVSNLLGDAPLMVDWEYAQVTDATYDLACLMAYYPRLELLQDRLMSVLGLDSGADRARWSLQRARFSLLNHLWERIHANPAG